jgi:AcrR family transcriptional regulator
VLFGEFWDERVDLRFAETPGEGDVVVRRQVLIRKEQHEMFVPDLSKLLKSGLVEIGQPHTVYFGSERARYGTDQPLVGHLSELSRATKLTQMTPPARPPRGRAAVEEALLEAASLLFADHGPQATSVRQIAAEADVNHGLVHHYFGSKEALLQAVLERSARQLAEYSSEQLTFPAADVAQKIDRHWRILARSLLDGFDPALLQRSYPLIEQLVLECRDRGMSESEATKSAARAVATEVGWRLLRGFIAGALQLDEAAIKQFDHGALASDSDFQSAWGAVHA